MNQLVSTMSRQGHVLRACLFFAAAYWLKNWAPHTTILIACQTCTFCIKEATIIFCQFLNIVYIWIRLFCTWNVKCYVWTGPNNDYLWRRKIYLSCYLKQCFLTLVVTLCPWVHNNKKNKFTLQYRITFACTKSLLQTRSCDNSLTYTILQEIQGG